MTEATNGYKKIVFGEFRLEGEARTLWRNGEEIHLAKRPLRVLFYLIENRERVVSRNELLDKFWDGHDVYDDALRKTVATIRHALDDTKKPPRFIETRYGKGFCFIGTIEEEGEKGRKKQSAVGSWQKRRTAMNRRQLITNDGQRTKTKDQKIKSEIRNPKSEIERFSSPF